jgi:hypothetical protein
MPHKRDSVEFGFLPSGHLTRDRIDEILKFGKVLVVGTESTRQLPNAFDGIKFGTVRWKIVEA